MFSKKKYKKISTKYMTRISTYKYVFRFQPYKTWALKISRKIERKKNNVYLVPTSTKRYSKWECQTNKYDFISSFFRFVNELFINYFSKLC